MFAQQEAAIIFCFCIEVFAGEKANPGPLTNQNDVGV